MPGRHVKARHRAPRSLKRSVSRLAGDVASSAPQATAAVAVVGAAGVAVGLGTITAVGGGSGQSSPGQASVDRVGLEQTVERNRTDGVSRSLSRPPLVAKQRKSRSEALTATLQEMSGADKVTVAPTDPRDIAMSKLSDFGWSTSEFPCLDALWTRESNWNYRAQNPYSGAYGIPQALPASKMATAGGDYLTNPATQIEWGLTYIQARYGSPCGAWSYWQGYSSY